jgi:hypothetical protein
MKERNVNMLNESYFPIVILLTKENKVMTCNSPEQVPSGKAFRILETRSKR